jgi:hypothetical protein
VVGYEGVTKVDRQMVGSADGPVGDAMYPPTGVTPMTRLQYYTVLGTQLKPAGARLSDHMSIQVAGRPGRDVSAKTGAGTKRQCSAVVPQ